LNEGIVNRPSFHIDSLTLTVWQLGKLDTAVG
jgi:hypothetical protein